MIDNDPRVIRVCAGCGRRRSGCSPRFPNGGPRVWTCPECTPLDRLPRLTRCGRCEQTMLPHSSGYCDVCAPIVRRQERRRARKQEITLRRLRGEDAR
jgi:hypothetical protein